MPHKEYKTAEKLLESIYAGNNLANKKKRDKRLEINKLRENFISTNTALHQHLSAQTSTKNVEFCDIHTYIILS